MRKAFSLTAIAVISFTQLIYAQKNDTEKEIRTILQSWNNAAKNRDSTTIMNMFDKAEDIMLVGSDSGEIFKGRHDVKQFVSLLFSQYSFSWDMQRIDISFNDNTAWAFTDGNMIVTDNSGAFVTPYRFTAIFVKRTDGWKWRLYNGSIPKGEGK